MYARLLTYKAVVSSTVKVSTSTKTVISSTVKVSTSTYR